MASANALSSLGKGALVSLEQAHARRGKGPHLLWNADVAYPKLAQHRLHVLAEAVDQPLDDPSPLGTFGLEPVQHDEEMQRQQREAALKRVRNAETPVENGEPCLRHNRAIEFFAVARAGAPSPQAVKRVQTSGHFA